MLSLPEPENRDSTGFRTTWGPRMGTYIVTGATSGIGRKAAEDLAEDGHGAGSSAAGCRPSGRRTSCLIFVSSYPLLHLVFSRKGCR